MAGYHIIEQRVTTLSRSDGYKVSENRIDILDFIREINEEPIPFSFGEEITVEGLDKLLFEADKEVNRVANDIRHHFTSNANKIENQKLTIYMVMLGRLKYGAYLLVEYAKKDVPLHLIFNKINTIDIGGNNVMYTTNANLSG